MNAPQAVQQPLLIIQAEGAVYTTAAAGDGDALDRFHLVPGVIHSLRRIALLGYTPILLQPSSSESERFYRKAEELLRGEGLEVQSRAADALAAVSPDSVYVGTDAVQRAAHLPPGVQPIRFGSAPHHDDTPRCTDWQEVHRCLVKRRRSAAVTRTSKETDLRVVVALDGQGQAAVRTGIGFFDHMLEQLALHSGCDLTISAAGDLHVDTHHTIEDTGLALGEAFLKALGNKRGIRRYGFALPMDDCLAQAALDFSGRPWLVWEAEFRREKIGEMPTEMFFHFFKSFSDAARCTLHIKAEGQNEHHKIEAIFKAVAKSVRGAVSRDEHSEMLPTTKGML